MSTIQNESMNTRLALASIHNVVKKHTRYCRVYSNKRKTGGETARNGISGNCISGHRIKYYICNPNAKQLAALNIDLANRFGLKAHIVCSGGCNWTSASLEIRVIKT